MSLGTISTHSAAGTTAFPHSSAPISLTIAKLLTLRSVFAGSPRAVFADFSHHGRHLPRRRTM